MLTNLIGAFNSTSYYDYGYHPVSSGTSYAALVPFFVILGLVSLFLIVCYWKVFQKSGRPGWASIIPIYNSWIMLEMGGQAGWWALLALIPFVGIISAIFVIMAEIEIARRFGKGNGFAALLVFLPFIGWPILAFGKAQYTDPSMSAPQGSAVPPQQPPVAPNDPVAPMPSVPAEPTLVSMQPTQPVAPTPPATPTVQPQVIEPTSSTPQDSQTPPPTV